MNIKKLIARASVVVLTLALLGAINPADAKAQYEDNLLERGQFDNGDFFGRTATQGTLRFNWQSEGREPDIILLGDTISDSRLQQMNRDRMFDRFHIPGTDQLAVRRLIIVNADRTSDHMLIRQRQDGFRGGVTVVARVGDNFYRRLGTRILRDQDFQIRLDARNDTIAFENIAGNFVTALADITIRR
ncbi:MAG: hypothetical protein AAB360_01055 [Patescibacteria group bacterium]